MTTTRKTAPADPRSLMTLDQFSRAVDTHAGRVIAFAAHVELLADIRARRTLINDHRSEVFEVVKAAYLRGDRTTGSGVVLRETEPTPVVIERAVSSDAVKRADKRLWEAARVPRPFVQAAAPKDVKAQIALAARQAVGSLPPVPSGDAPADVAVAVYQSLPSVNKLNDAEDAQVAVLRAIGAEQGWDGLPIKFADGWTVGLDRLTFDGDVLRELDPAAWDRLAVEKRTGGVKRIYLGRQGADGEIGEGL